MINDNYTILLYYRIHLLNQFLINEFTDTITHVECYQLIINIIQLCITIKLLLRRSRKCLFMIENQLSIILTKGK